MKTRKLLLLTIIGVLTALCLLHARASLTTAQSSESPKVVAAATPLYPPIAVAVRASGDVVVEVEIDAGGKVSAATARSGHPLLQHAANQAARRWQFEPVADGSSSRTARLTFNFRMVEGKQPAAELTPVFMPPYRVEIVGDPANYVQVVNH